MQPSIRPTVLLAVLALCGRSAAQNYRQFTFDLNHRLNLPHTPILGDLQTSARYFDHTWIQDQYNHGVTWDAVPPWQGGGPPPYNVPQPASFNPYGIEFLGWLLDYYDPSFYHYHIPPTEPYNGCVRGHTSVVPACGAAVSPVTIGHTPWIPSQGTGGPWVTTSWVPSNPLTYATSEIEVQPFTSGSGAFDGRVRTSGQFHYDYGVPGYSTYAFAWAELECLRNIQPVTYPTGIPVTWFLSNIFGQSHVPMWWPPNTPGRTRISDPITFSLTDASSGQTTTGTLFELYVDLSDGGLVTGGNGSLWLDTAFGGLRVRMDHPLINPRGSIDLELASGVVVTSRATGCFASMGLPPVGASTPLSIQFPAPSFDFVFDPAPIMSGDCEVVLRAGGSGAQELPEPEPTGAACSGGACTSGVTEAQALASGATWQGAGTACPDVPYYVDSTRVGFEDISLFGSPSLASACDDCGEIVPLGFTFDYFGVPQSTVGISSNGYLAFSGPLDTYLNLPIPSSAGPNGVIAGYWDDLNPLLGGEVRYATLGTAPYRRFIAQWSDVPHYGIGEALHTFQIVLSETTGEIVLRYLDVPLPGGAISPTVGAEDASGAFGLDLGADGLDSTATRRLVPAPGVTCSLPPVVAYCTAGTTTNGCAASMSAAGVPSLSSSSGFVVSCDQVEGQKQGLLFYGVNGPVAQPWGPGSTSFLCVKAPFQRTSTASSGGTANACDGRFDVDLLAYLATHPNALGTPFAAGQMCWLQGWFRDPPTPKTTNLSDGLRVTFQP
jgi:hypothetical protein